MPSNKRPTVPAKARKGRERVWRIKPLVWVKQSDPEHYRAESVVGVLDLKAAGWYWFLRIHGDACGHCGTDLEGAKVQADIVYRQQLRKALEEVKP